MATEVCIERRIGTGEWASVATQLDPEDGLWTDSSAHTDGVEYSYRARYYDTSSEEYSAYSNVGAVVFAHTLICIERKTGVGGVYAEQTVQQWRNAEWADPGPFANGTTYYYRARIYDTTVPEYRDYGDEDSVTFGAPSASGAYYYAMLRE